MNEWLDKFCLKLQLTYLNICSYVFVMFLETFRRVDRNNQDENVS